MNTYKCVVVGDTRTGKTALLDAFVNKNPCTGEENDYIPTVIDHHECTTTIAGSEQLVTLALFDTAGTDKGLKLRKCLYPQTKVILVVFSVFDPTSFNNVKSKWIPELNARCPGVPWVLVGTQADLRSDNSALALLRAQQSCGTCFHNPKCGQNVSELPYGDIFTFYRACHLHAHADAAVL